MTLKIGELAQLTGCLPVTIRFYEKEGLLKPAKRGNSNYRFYNLDDYKRLRFIMHCRNRRMSLEDIKKLLYLREHPEQGCGFAHRILDDQIKKIAEELKSLQELQKELASMKSQLSCETKGICSIVKKLDEEDECKCCKKIININNKLSNNLKDI